MENRENLFDSLFCFVMKNTENTKNLKFREQKQFSSVLCVFKNCSKEQFSKTKTK